MGQYHEEDLNGATEKVKPLILMPCVEHNTSTHQNFLVSFT